MPFGDDLFDAVFTNGSLHEWDNPKSTLNEIWRVLKTGGRFFISDLRRDIFPLMKWLMWLCTKPKEIRPGLVLSMNAAYTTDELNELVKGTKLKNYQVTSNLVGLKLLGIK